MKSIHFLALSVFSILFSTSCASYKKVNAVSTNSTHEYQDTAMVNIVSASRMPAANGSLELSQANSDVNVSAQLIKLPGDALQHAQLLFTVKDHPEIAGQITGNSGGSELSMKFTKIIMKMMTEGVNASAADALVATQNKFKEISKLSADQREAAIRTALLEARDKLISSY